MRYTVTGVSVRMAYETDDGQCGYCRCSAACPRIAQVPK
ncbi:Uncharacterised protein [Bordetella pertussis]|nr:Uncharacterised protein [Bordetella pertussis]